MPLCAYCYAIAMVSAYMLAGCPSVVANLWDVTDKDADRMCESMLKSWIRTPDNALSSEFDVHSPRQSRNRGSNPNDESKKSRLLLKSLCEAREVS